MSNVLSYKGYFAVVQYDAEQRILYGNVEGISDGIYFESTSAGDVEIEFQEAVDDYLDYCLVQGKEPEKPYRGSFNVRVGPELHKRAVRAAAEKNESLNQFVANAIAAAL